MKWFSDMTDCISIEIALLSLNACFIKDDPVSLKFQVSANQSTAIVARCTKCGLL